MSIHRPPARLIWRSKPLTPARLPARLIDRALHTRPAWELAEDPPRRWRLTFRRQRQAIAALTVIATLLGVALVWQLATTAPQPVVWPIPMPDAGPPDTYDTTCGVDPTSEQVPGGEQELAVTR